MPLNKGKHVIAEIEGVRCTVVETGLTEPRAKFLKELLENNKYEVKMEKEKGKDGNPLETFVLGVTDILFNAVVIVYMQKLKTRDGLIVTPAYWNQWNEPVDVPYWHLQR
jgi:hypothetical protein